MEQSIVFFNDKGRGEELASDLKEALPNLNIIFTHGSMSQAERMRIMNKLRMQQNNVVISTDLLCRGIDICKIGLVVNFDKPASTATYYHRIGRTGRFGAFGISFSMLTQKEYKEC